MENAFRAQARAVIEEIIRRASLKSGNILVVGCSTSEIVGSAIGTSSTPEVAVEVYEELSAVAGEHGVYLAVQCCEHLNRAIVIESEAARGLDEVNVIPQPKAGGAMATAAYRAMRNPVVVEQIRADAGIDIGFTMIGMHLKSVAVPVRLENDYIGSAKVLAARTRPKFIGGERAVYDKSKL